MVKRDFQVGTNQAGRAPQCGQAARVVKKKGPPKKGGAETYLQQTLAEKKKVGKDHT